MRVLSVSPIHVYSMPGPQLLFGVDDFGKEPSSDCYL